MGQYWHYNHTVFTCCKDCCLSHKSSDKWPLPADKLYLFFILAFFQHILYHSILLKVNRYISNIFKISLLFFLYTDNLNRKRGF